MKKPTYPISYYGGKIKMVKEILPLIPTHKIYVEPFCGGASVFFAKDNKAELEVLNDLDGFVVEFYRQMATNFDEFYGEVQGIMHSRAEHANAQALYNLDDSSTLSSKDKALAFWVLTTQSMFKALDAGWGYDKKTDSTASAYANKRDNLIYFKSRLRTTQIESLDAIECIKRYDSDSTFFYVDPPYPGTHCQHYSHYTQENFENLLECLSSIKGKFILSSFKNEALDHFKSFKVLEFEKSSSASAGINATGGRKVELLITNF